jgi:DNA mismatch endonuclease (patch repair protein)
MADVFTKAKRSEVMSKIRSRGNRDTELALAHLMRVNRISGWRRHLPITGRPDFAFRRQRVAVFVDGCFWHRCPKCRLRPATNRVFWEQKLGRNQQRDRTVSRTLRISGWRVIRIWEHELRKPASVARKLLKALA